MVIIGVKQITDKIWKFTGTDSANVYLDIEKKLVIDCGNRRDHSELREAILQVIELNKIKIVVFTHMHYDHIGNFDLFPNAEIYASKQEINDFIRDKPGTVLSEEIIELLEKSDKKLNELPLEIGGLKVLNTPGHTSGSVCFWLEDKKILFSGDTMFGPKRFGRMDLPTSNPELFENGLKNLFKCNFEILCPGHDYSDSL